MKAEKYLKNKLQDMNGSLLIIGQITSSDEKIITKITNISETYWLNSSSVQEDEDEGITDIGKDISLNKLREYLKQGVDNVVCEYSEVKDHIPGFIKESLNVTKGNLYLFFEKKDRYTDILKKFKRYKLNYKIEELDEYNVVVVEVNDIVVNIFKEKYYYIHDSMEKYYTKIIENI